MPKVSDEYRRQRREQILAAARRCFVRDGFHATSMQDLVTEAGMSSGAVYRYFPSKAAMIEAIAAENLAQVVTVARESFAASADPGAALAAVLRFVETRHAEDDFAAVALLVWSEAMRNSALADELRRAFAEIAEGLSGGAKAAGDVVELLLCVLPGYLVHLALRDRPGLDGVPATVAALLGAAAGRPVAAPPNP